MMAWIGNGAVHAIIYVLIAIVNLFLFVLKQLLEFVVVFVDCVGKIGEIVRQHIGIGKTQHHGANGLRERAPVDKVFVGKMSKPIEVVVNGVVDYAIIFAAKRNIE